jgi:hypothetical protein
MSLFDQNLSVFRALKPTYTRRRIGCLGRYNGDGTIDPDPRADLPADYVWARFDGDRGATRVKNLRVRAAWGTPVWIEYNELTREDEVREVHSVLAPQTFGGALAAALNVPEIPASVPLPTSARDIVPGGVFVDEGGGLRVRILPMWIPGGAWWDGAAILTLTPTAAANRKTFCVIGVDSLTNAPVTALTADRGLAVTLVSGGTPTAAGAADLRAVMDAQPAIYWVGAVELAHGAAAINPAGIVDTRFWRIPALTGTDGTQAGRRGLVPAPAATDSAKYLRGDATWTDINSAIQWGAPGTIGSITPNAGAFTTLSAAGDVTIGSAAGMSGRLTIDPGAGQRGIDVQLDSTPGDALRVRNYTGTTIFQVGAAGRLLFRPTEDDNEVFKMFDLNGSTIFTMGTLAGSTLLRIKSPATFNGMFIGAVDSANNTLMNVNYKGQMVVFGRDNGANSLLNTLNFGRNSSNTPGAGFGAQIALSLESSTTENTSVGSIDWLWQTATHASRVPDLVFNLIDYGGTREIMRLRATGTAGALGFFGAVPAARQTGGAAAAGAAYGATEQTMLQTVYDALRTFGFIT